MNRSEQVVRKEELVQRVAGRLGLTKTLTGEVVGAFLDEVGGALAEGKAVVLSGFGTFDVREYAARQGVHPRTGKAMPYPRQVAPGFRAGLGLKRRVRKGVGGA